MTVAVVKMLPVSAASVMMMPTASTPVASASSLVTSASESSAGHLEII